MLNFNHLYYFYITVKSGTVTAAADHLRISQPSLSSQLKVLEGNFNVKLFRKFGRNNQLTDDGKFIFDFCQKMFETAEEMTDSILRRASPSMRMINIGVTNEVERSFVGLFVDRFMNQTSTDQYSKIKVISGTHDQLAEALNFRELDIILTHKPVQDPDFVALRCAEIPVLLAVCKDHPKWMIQPHKKDQISSDEFFFSNLTRWIMPFPGIKLRAEIDSFYEDHHLQGQVIFECDAIAAQLQSVIDGLGVAFFPTAYLARDIKEKSINLLGPQDGFWKHSLWCYCHAKCCEDPDILMLVDIFNDICASTSLLPDHC